jgi:integrase
VITPLQALCLAERCALLSGQDTDFVMNVFAAWTGVRWGELLAVEGWDGQDSPLQFTEHGIATYAVDWQLREIEGVVCKSAPKDGSYRVLDLPPFLAGLMRCAMDNRLGTCHCPLNAGRPSCKGPDPTEPNYLFLGPKAGHPRRSNYADRYLTPAAEGLHPARKGVRRPVYVTAEPWPGIPIRQGNRKATAADMAEATWPNLTGKFKPHDDRHTHATWLEMGRVASDATFGGSGERPLPAVQRAALGQAQSHDGSCTTRDLGCHHALAPGRTMMQPVRLQRIAA